MHLVHKWHYAPWKYILEGDVINKKNVGKNIQTLRNALGLSQAYLAELLGISTIHLSHVETGVAGMSLDLMLTLCHHLAVTPNDLLRGEYDNPSDNPDLMTFFERSPYLSKEDQSLLLGISSYLAKKNQEEE